MGIKILGTGSYAPERILTNVDLEKLVDTSDEWIRTRTGIEERKIAADNESASDMAEQAAKNALDMAGITAEELDIIVVATITGDQPIPSTACILQKKIQAPNAVCFDLQAACSGFIFALEVLNSMMQSNPSFKKALVVGVEKLTYLTDWEDRNTCVLFGDGAGAMVLENQEGANGVIASKIATDGNYTDILQVPAGGSAKPIDEKVIEERSQYITMAGQEVFKLAVTAMVGSSKDVLAEAGIDVSEIRWLVPHQANLRIIKAVGKRLGLTEENVYINVNKYGNTSSASIPIAIDELVRGGKIERGEYLLLTAFGSGLTWGASLIQW
jgi:3-oxoacyl-[acyl-carrier-protein] synthase-3